MDVVLNNNSFPGNSSPVSEVKSGAKEATRDTSRSSSTPAADPKAEAFSLVVSTQAKDSVELASRIKPADEAGKTDGKKEGQDKKEDQDKKVATAREKNVVVNETLLQYRIEESENKETGQTNKELVVYLMDKKSGEVIRQIPSDDFYDKTNNRSLPSSGIFVDQEG